MPNAIKYSTTIPTGSLLKGTVALGVTTASISGPTSTTGWYYGPNPPSSSLYQIFETAASGDPDVYCPQSNAELIQFVKTKGATGANTSSLSASLAWIGTQSNLMAANFEYPNIVTSGSLLNVDAGFVGSYPTTASNWYDLSGNNSNGILTNGPIFDSANSGSIVFDGVDDFVPCTGSFTVTSATFVTWIKRNGDQTQYAGILFSRGTNTTGMNFYLSNQLGYHWNDVAATYNWASGLTIPNLTWCMIAISVTSTAATAYLCQTSGITTATNTTSHASSVLNSINIARDSGGGGRFFKGNIAISQLYNRALSANEITQNFNALRGRFGV
jgi:hypothetical protein